MTQKIITQKIITPKTITQKTNTPARQHYLKGCTKYPSFRVDGDGTQEPVSFSHSGEYSEGKA